MSFPRRLLHEDERVVVDQRPHWRSFAGAASALVVAVGVLVATAVAGLDQWLQLAAAALTLLALARFVVRYTRWAGTRTVVTTARFVHRRGALAKRGVELPLSQVGRVAVEQSLADRLLRSGDLVIEAVGDDRTQRFTDVSRPEHVQRQLQRLVDDDRRGGATVPEQLARLGELRRRGVITDDEFGSGKASLLERL